MILELLFVILPDGSTLLHKIIKNFEALEFIHSKIINEELVKNPIENIGKNVPYVKNLDGQTPLDVAIEGKDGRSADKIIQIIKGLSFDSHFDETAPALEAIFKMGLPSFTDYFDARLYDASLIGLDI